MNHLLPAVLPANRDSSGDYPYPDPSQKLWWRTATVETEPYLLPKSGAPAARGDQYADVVVGGAAAQARELCAKLQVYGLEVLILNQTRPDIGVPVVKVVVPGLRHFWTRFAPGRLYDVPVAMGWRANRLAERDLNPIAMFL